MLAPHDLLRRIRTFHEGVLLLDGTTQRARFVLDPLSGEPVLPVPAIAFETEQVVLCLPDDGFDNPECVQVVGLASEIDPLREEACDRFGAYFGKPAFPRFARLRVASVKRLDDVLDGDLVRLANPLRKSEGALCKFANAHEVSVAHACERLLGTRPTKPLVVGVDPWGIDVRATFGIMRLEFPQPVSTDDEARQAIAALLAL
jgi:hypothetical protein